MFIFSHRQFFTNYIQWNLLKDTLNSYEAAITDSYRLTQVISAVTGRLAKQLFILLNKDTSLIKDKLCGSYRTMAIQIYLLKWTTSLISWSQSVRHLEVSLCIHTYMHT